jgi:hypothetical protein
MEISFALKRRQLMRRVDHLVLVPATTLTLAGVAPALHGQGQRAEIQKRITAEFKRIKRTADRSGIATAGSVLDLHKDGLVMCGPEAIERVACRPLVPRDQK